MKNKTIPKSTTFRPIGALPTGLLESYVPVPDTDRRPVCRSVAEIEPLTGPTARSREPDSAQFCRYRRRQAAAAFCLNQWGDRKRRGCHIRILRFLPLRDDDAAGRPGTYRGTLGLRARVLSVVLHANYSRSHLGTKRILFVLRFM